MKQFKSIAEVLSSDFSLLGSGYSEAPKTDRVLKSTKIEQMIYEDLRTDTDSLDGVEAAGGEKLKTFPSLVNDVFQSVYGLDTKFIDESSVSALSRQFNRSILEYLTKDESYAAIKAVCEGKELPAMGATEEFSEKLLSELDSLMNKATGGKGKVEAIDRLEEDKKSLYKQLAELIQQYENTPKDSQEKLEKKILDTANRAISKKEQSEMYGKLISDNMHRNASVVNAVISMAAKEALERAKGIEAAVISWGNETAVMSKNPVNMEILKRTAASQKLRYIAQFLGRYKEMLNSKRLAGYTYSRGEKYDIEYGNKISRALTSELSLLSAPELIPLFIRKYQNKGLKQYRRREAEYKGRGDIIVCLDESSSTFGENNAYGMAVAMVLYEICRVNGANFALIHFSTEVKVDYYPKGEIPEPSRLMDTAETLLGGGTNFEKPIKEAIKLTQDGKLDKPDIVFITDGICSISDSFQKEFADYKAKTGARLTGILLDEGENIPFSLETFADSIYRTSELLGDNIVENLIEERI